MKADSETQAAWIPCPGLCDDFYCVIHDLHAYDCPCPAIEGWMELGIDPYTASAEPSQVTGP